MTRSRAQSGCVGRAALLFVVSVRFFLLLLLFFFIADVTNHIVLNGRDGRVNVHLRLIVANC